MTKRQKINETVKSGIFGLLTGIVLMIVGYLWVVSTNLLIDLEGFGLGDMVLWFPYVGYAVIGVGILVFIYGIIRLIVGVQARTKVVSAQQNVKKNQEAALFTERSTFDKKRIKGVIFDLDGTLLDTLDDLTDSLNEGLLLHGYQTVTREHVEAVVGDGMRNMVVRTLDKDKSDEEIDQVLESFLSAYDVLYQNKTKPYKGIVELLENLNARGYLLAVISNKKDEYTKKLINKLFPNISFVDIIGDHEIYPRKPDPTTTQLIIEEMMLAKSQVVFIGDSQVDINTAKNANVPVIAVTWGFRSEAELVTLEPDYLAHEASDIYDIIDSMNQQ